MHKKKPNHRPRFDFTDHPESKYRMPGSESDAISAVNPVPISSSFPSLAGRYRTGME
jgi:hypothetical protein